MKPSNIRKAILAAIAARRTLMIWGPPGIGKTGIVNAVAKEIDWRLIDPNITNLEPIDLRGLPLVTRQKTTWATPDIFPTEGEGIFFIDELSAARPEMQPPLYQLIQRGRLGEYAFPPGWRVIAAGNRQTDRSVAYRMSAALANKMFHVTAEVDLEDWCTWAAQESIAPAIIAFCKFRPELLHCFEPDTETGAFPSPRAWEMLSDLIRTDTLDTDIEFDVIAGTVGHAAAIEFMGFLQIWRSLPAIDSILQEPDTAIVPTETSALIAISSALARRATRDNIAAVITYLARLSNEYGAFTLKLARDRDESLSSTQSYVTWCTAHGGI